MAGLLQTHSSAFCSIPRSTAKDSPTSFAYAGAFSSPTMGFGFQSTNTHGQPSNIMMASSAPGSSNVLRMKRRHEDDDVEGGRTARDVAMDRSPTPERPRRGVPKRARVAPGSENDQHGKETKDGKPQQPKDKDPDVDVGLLLASLPSEALLPLLNSLLTAQPALKPMILSLIPRPTLATAIQSINASAKKLRDAYPYSNANPFSQPTPFGSSSGFGSARSSAFGGSTMGFGFGQHAQAQHSAFATPTNATPGMRDDYILSRLRPHISEFVSTCSSYLPYFSLVPRESATSSGPSHHAQLKDKIHPTEAFQFLQQLTSHIISQPPLTQSSLAPMLMPRLVEEWNAWIDRVDVAVNHEGGMFGQEMVQGWMRTLDEYATAKGHGLEVMRGVRDRWVLKVGWLMGRQAHPESMQEL